MNNSFRFFDEQMEVEIPEIPFDPPESREIPERNAPMIYVESPEQFEYLVKTFELSNAFEFEKNLNALGRKGWWLMHIIQREENILFVFSRRSGG